MISVRTLPACLASAALALAASLAGPSLHAQQTPYHVAHTYSLGVSGGFDYMAFDPQSHLLYIAQGDQVLVFDAAKGAIVGKLPGMSHTHGIVFDANGRTGYISDGGANMVRVFDRHTMKETAQIPAGSNPDGMVIEPTTHHLFAFNGHSKNVSVIDTASRSVIATIALPGKPEFPTADGRGFVYDNIEDMHEVVKIDARTNKVVATWPLGSCESPSGMAIDPPIHRIASVCDNGKMPILDTDNGKIVAMPSIGTGPDAARFDPAHKLFFSSNGDSGTLSIVQEHSPNSYSLLQTVKTLHGARTVALRPGTGSLYTIASDPKSTAPANAKPLVLVEISR